jgi:hypothetical protein
MFLATIDLVANDSLFELTVIKGMVILLPLRSLTVTEAGSLSVHQQAAITTLTMVFLSTSSFLTGLVDFVSSILKLNISEGGTYLGSLW